MHLNISVQLTSDAAAAVEWKGLGICAVREMCESLMKLNLGQEKQTTRTKWHWLKQTKNIQKT